MKKYLLSFVLLLMGAVLCYGQEQKTFTGKGPYFEYSIEYSSSWKAIDMYGFAVITEPKENKEKVLVMVGDLSKKPMDVEEFVNVWLKITTSGIQNFQIIDKGETTIDGEKALFHIYSGEKDGMALKCKHYTLSKKSNIYELTYEATKENFDKHLNTAEKIIKSLKIIK